MANTSLSDIAQDVVDSAGGERTKPALGNGAAKCGDACGIDGTTGKVVATDVGVSELFEGFMRKNVDVDIDTAIGDGVPCTLVVPTAGKSYNVRVADPGGAVVAGIPYGFSTTAYAMAALAALTTAGHRATLEKPLANGDLYGKIIWGI